MVYEAVPLVIPISDVFSAHVARFGEVVVATPRLSLWLNIAICATVIADALTPRLSSRRVIRLFPPSPRLSECLPEGGVEEIRGLMIIIYDDLVRSPFLTV